MAIDIKMEDLIRLADVPNLKCMPKGKGGKRLVLSTIHRWAIGTKGGVKLETLKVGGTTCTSVEALQRFFDALSGNQSPPHHASSLPQAWPEEKGKSTKAPANEGRRQSLPESSRPGWMKERMNDPALAH